MKFLKSHPVLWIVICGITGATVIVVLARAPHTNSAATAPDHVDPLLRTRHYPRSPQEVSQIIQQVMPTLRTYGNSWKYIQSNSMKSVALVSNPGHDTLHAEVPVLTFTDDLTVTLSSNNKETTVNVRSASRVGKGDFGENRRHIIQLLTALDQRLK